MLFERAEMLVAEGKADEFVAMMADKGLPLLSGLPGANTVQMGKLLHLPITPQLAAAIDTMPASDAMCFLVTEWGKPFSIKGFGGWFRDQFKG